MDSNTPKRTLPTSPSVKRAKTEHDIKPSSHRPLPLTAPHGVERICLPASLNVRRLSSRDLEQLANERTEILREQGRHVVGLPVVLDDGIILNWIRHQSGPAYRADGIPLVVRQTTSSAEHKKRKLQSACSSSCGAGSSAVDAIVIDSDEDINPVLPPSRSVVPKGPPVNRGTSLYRDVMPYLNSGVQLAPAGPESKAKDDQGPSRHPFHPPARETMSSDTTPSCAITRGKVTCAPFEHPSYDASATTSDSDADETDDAVNEAGDIDQSKISARHPRSPPTSSLPPVRNLVARRKQQEHNTLTGGTIVTSQESQDQKNKAFSEEAPTSTGSEIEKLDFQVSDPQLKRVPLPKTVHGRARRLLVPDSADLPLVAVTMRGDCHFIKRKEKHRISGYSLPNPGVFRHVADVCMVGNTAVLGCDRGTDQISFLSVVGKPQIIDVTCSPHCSGPRYQDTEKRGVTCLAAIHAKGGHIKFLSGGYDGTIREWMADVEKLDKPRSKKVVSHGASIMALAYRDRDRSMVASAQKRLHVTDLNRCKTMVYPFSNDIQQIHIHPQAAYVTLLEVRHLDHQIQLYDSRKANFDSEPCLSFGYRNANSKFPATHTRGSVHLVHFVKASEDGCVLLWDFRNSKRAVVERRFQQTEKVVHTIFADRDIATFGQGVVTFFEDYLA